MDYNNQNLNNLGNITSENYIESPSNYVNNIPQNTVDDNNIGTSETIFLGLQSIPIIGILFLPIEWLFDFIRGLFKNK